LVIGDPLEPAGHVYPRLAVGIHTFIIALRTVAKPDEGGRTMNIGAGIALVVIGLILLLGVVEVDIPWVNDYAVGVLLTLAGVVVVVLTLFLGTRIWTARRGSGTRVVERRVEGDIGGPDVM
jgi:hypothetical protein